jgi:hypothetical protein
MTETKSITTINKTNIQTLRSTIQKALDSAVNRVGLTAKVNGIKYGETYFTFWAKVETKTSGEQLFKKHAEWYGLKPEWFGLTFSFRNELYRITGWNDNSRRYKIASVRTSDNQVFGFTPELVKQQLDTKKAA